MTGIVVVALLSNRHLCAEFHYYLKMLGEKKKFIINVNLKKYPRQIQHNVTDLKVELLVKIGKNCEL